MAATSARGTTTAYRRMSGCTSHLSASPKWMCSSPSLQSQAGISSASRLGLDPDNLYLALPPALEDAALGPTGAAGLPLPDLQRFLLSPGRDRLSGVPGATPAFEFGINLRQLLHLPFGTVRPHVPLPQRGTHRSDGRCGSASTTAPVPGSILETAKSGGRGVDLLSAVTTMEARADIGSLQAVMMSNMPPRRFNYQQRVGRAGRRGAGLSLAVTFCRGRSHDDYYYARTSG